PLVNPATGYRIMLSAPDVTQKINESKSNAAEAYYQAGIRFSKMSNSMDIQKKAALEFAAALKLIPGYKDAYLKFEQSRNLAVKRIAVVPVENLSVSKTEYGAIAEMLTDHIISRIISQSKDNQFTEVIARSQMEAVLHEQQLSASGLVSASSSVNLGQMLGAHEILTGKILQITVTPARTTWVNQTAKARVVVGREEYVDESGKTKERDVHGEVSCDFSKFSKTASASVSGSFSIVDVETGKIRMQESIEIKFPWSDTWCRKLSGDERALSNSIKNLMGKSEPYPPEESEMVFSALRELGDAVVSKAEGYLIR
ncbi:MAG: CsgG/HfaB family protein, partial [Candidatus Cloacimonetes bacterium]|nr:CsgG/HfaB family protein [Candidatus Cloacimonadota bacterium]